MNDASWVCSSKTGLIAVCLAFCATGCSALVSTGSADVAGAGGAALASALTTNAAAAAGIGLGVQAAARAGVQYSERQIHRAAQDEIAKAAGDLRVGEVRHWRTHHRVPLERSEHGRVSVSRIVSTAPQLCKEAVFSVDALHDNEPRSSFYVATVCREGAKWKWASAEPATARWGSLQ